MNLATFGVVFLVLVTSLSVVASIVYYVRHWTQRQRRLAGTAITEGVFFKRYLPPPLRTRYDTERQAEAQRLQRRINTLRRAVALIASGGLLAVILLAVLTHWHRVTWIDLTEDEVAALNYTEHLWVRQVDEKLPRLNALLPLLRERGVALIGAEADFRRDAGGRRSINAVAADQWKKFLNAHRVGYRSCSWQVVLDGCAEAGIHIILPGPWNLKTVERLLGRDASLLFYGPPAQSFSGLAPFELHGLRFTRKQFERPTHLALAGDQALTLGFDAGLVIAAATAFTGYAAQSAAPQAVAMDNSRFIGGELQTRLYARRAGNGRLVWMDFSPNVRDHGDTLNARHLEALNAAVFRYLLRREYSGWATWPGGRRFAGMISEDTEDKFERAQRVAKLARRLDLPMTWFILSNEAQQHRALLRELAETGEIACHGDSHASFSTSDRASQVRRLARCRKVLAEVAGAMPRAFRPPYEQHNDATIDAVANNGMTHYFAEAGGDRAVPVLQLSQTTGVTLVSLPRIGADDYELWHLQKLGYRESIEHADHELLWAETLGGLLAFDFHTQFVDDEHLRVVEHYGRRLQREEVFLATAGEIADWWRVRDNLNRRKTVAADRISRYQPVLLRVRADGSLVRVARKAKRSTAKAGNTARLVANEQ